MLTQRKKGKKEKKAFSFFKSSFMRKPSLSRWLLGVYIVLHLKFIFPLTDKSDPYLFIIQLYQTSAINLERGEFLSRETS